MDRLLKYSWMLSLILVPYYVRLDFISDSREALT